MPMVDLNTIKWYVCDPSIKYAESFAVSPRRNWTVILYTTEVCPCILDCLFWCWLKSLFKWAKQWWVSQVTVPTNYFYTPHSTATLPARVGTKFLFIFNWPSDFRQSLRKQWFETLLHLIYWFLCHNLKMCPMVFFSLFLLWFLYGDVTVLM